MLRIRFAKKEDLPNILKLMRMWLKEKSVSPSTTSYTKESIKNTEKIIKEKRILVVLVENKIVGFLFYSFWTKDSCSLDMIFIMKKFRRKGIGKKLIKKFLAIKSIKNCKKVWVYTDSIELERFYSQFGFKKEILTMVKNNRMP